MRGRARCGCPDERAAWNRQFIPRTMPFRPRYGSWRAMRQEAAAGTRIATTQRMGHRHSCECTRHYDWDMRAMGALGERLPHEGKRSVQLQRRLRGTRGAGIACVGHASTLRMLAGSCAHRCAGVVSSMQRSGAFPLGWLPAGGRNAMQLSGSGHRVVRRSELQVQRGAQVIDERAQRGEVGGNGLAQARAGHAGVVHVAQ